MAGICNTLKNEKKYIKHALEHENSTSKIHEAVKNIKQMTSKEKLNLETKEWLTVTEKQQSEIITNSLENTFYNSNIVAVKYISVTRIITPVTLFKIKKQYGI